MFKISELSSTDAVFNNLTFKRVCFAQKEIDSFNMVGSDGVITLNQPGYYHIHAQTYWTPPLVETSCYVTICDVDTGAILAVGNDTNSPGEHPSVTVSDLIYSDGTRRLEIKAEWISTASRDTTATHDMQTGGNYVYAFGYKVG